MKTNDQDQPTLLNHNNIISKRKVNSQTIPQNQLSSIETNFIELNKKVEKKIYDLYEVGGHVDEKESDLKQKIINFKTNYALQLQNIQLKYQMTKKMNEIYDKKILDIMELKRVNQIKLQKIKDRILELQEIEIFKNKYTLQLEQAKLENLDQEKINDVIEKKEETTKQFTININEIDEKIRKTKYNIDKINQTIKNIHKNKQSFFSNITELSKKIESQASENLNSNQNLQSFDASNYDEKIYALRKLQLSHLSKVSNLFSKKILIESQLSDITKKIQVYRSAPKFISMNTEYDKKSNEYFTHLQQKYLKKTEAIKGNILDLFSTLQNDILLTRKEKKARMKDIVEIKNQIIQYNQNVINLTNYLNQIVKKIKNMIKSTEKITKLIDYYDECANVNPISFSLPKKKLDKIRISAYQLAKKDVNNEELLLSQIKECKNQSKQLIFKISKQRLKNQILREKINEIINKAEK